MENEIYKTSKYNGANHEIKLYYNPNDYAVNREGKYYLINRNAKPSEIILQGKPLSANVQEMQPLVVLDTNIRESICWNIVSSFQLVQDWQNYDVIIVSNLYASRIQKVCAPYYLNCRAYIEQMNTLDYLDRLYTLVPLYAENPSIGPTSKIGCVGFEKAFYQRPQEYLLKIQNGLKPSIVSMKNCVERYKSYSQKCGAGYDSDTSRALFELERYISIYFSTYSAAEV